MAQSFVLVDRRCLVSSLSCFFSFKVKNSRGSGRGGGGGTRRRWYLREPVSLRMLLRNGIANLRTHSRSLKMRRGLFRDARCSQTSWLEVHPRKQCLNQVGGQFQQDPMATTCWVPGARNPPWEPSWPDNSFCLAPSSEVKPRWVCGIGRATSHAWGLTAREVETRQFLVST